MYRRRLSTRYFFGVPRRDPLAAEPVSLKMLASLSDFISEFERPTIESNWHVRIGLFLLVAVDLVLAVFEKSDLFRPLMLKCLRVSKSLKRPFAIEV